MPIPVHGMQIDIGFMPMGMQRNCMGDFVQVQRLGGQASPTVSCDAARGGSL